MVRLGRIGIVICLLPVPITPSVVRIPVSVIVHPVGAVVTSVLIDCGGVVTEGGYSGGTVGGV